MKAGTIFSIRPFRSIDSVMRQHPIRLLEYYLKHILKIQVEIEWKTKRCLDRNLASHCLNQIRALFSCGRGLVAWIKGYFLLGGSEKKFGEKTDKEKIKQNRKRWVIPQPIISVFPNGKMYDTDRRRGPLRFSLSSSLCLKRQE